MLTSDDRAGDARRCRELGVTRYLIKPITHVGALWLASCGAGWCRTAALATRSRLQPTILTRRSLRILVAEDNPVNQTLAARDAADAKDTPSRSSTTAVAAVDAVTPRSTTWS